MGVKRAVIDLNVLSASVGLVKCRGLLLLHAFSGCDYTSGFYGVGKTKWLDKYLSAGDAIT